MTPAEMSAGVREHQAQHPDQEVCGFFVRGVPLKGDATVRQIRAENIADPPTDGAIPDRRSVREATSRGIVYAYHTHIDDTGPGENDQGYCNAAGVPYIIVGPTRCDVLAPVPPWAKLLGVGLEWEKTDCVSLVWDFTWQVLGIELPKRPAMAEDDFPPDHDFFHAVYADLGYVAMKPSETLRRFGDVISFAMPKPVGPDGKKHENHVGIYVGDSKMLHRPYRGSSEVVDLTKPWLDRAAWVYRLRVLRDAG